MDAPHLNKLTITPSDIRYGIMHCDETNISDELHTHDCFELYVNFSGDVSFIVNDTLYNLKNGDFVFLRPYDMHSYAVNGGTDYDAFILWFECDIPQVKKFMESKDFTHVYSVYSNDRDVMLSNFLCFEEDERINNEIAKITCFFNILNIVLAQKKGTDCYESAKIVKLPAEMHRVMAYINKNFTRIEFVHEIADNNYVSSATLNRWFRKYFRTTPCEYLQSKKLAYARKLLDEGMSVIDSCMASGFSDCSYFISIFKKKHGVTPAKYAKNTKADDNN